MPMKSPVLSLLLAAVAATTAQAAIQPGSADARLMGSCEAWLDARGDSMAADEVKEVRRRQFALQLALASLNAGRSALSERDYQLAHRDAYFARRNLAAACGVPAASIQ